MRSLITILAFAGKEIRQVFRQPKLIVAVILGPFLILGLFAAGFQPAPPPLRTMLVIPPGSLLTGDGLREDLGGSVEVVDVVEDVESARALLEAGEVELVIAAPDDPLATIESGEQAQVTVWHSRVDPFDRAALEVSGQTAVDHLNRAVLAEAVVAAQGEADEALDEVGVARTAAEALGEALRSGDARAVNDSRDQLDSALGELEAGLGGGSFRDVLGGGDEAEVTDSVVEMRDTVAGFQPGDDDALARVEGIETRLAEVEGQLQSLSAVPAEVLVEPFVVEVETVSGIDVPVTTYYTPAVVLVLLQHIIVTFAALSIVSERALGTTEIFRVGPMRTAELMTGKALGYLGIGVVVGAALAAGVVYLFGTPMGGSWWWLALVLALTIVASLGLGFAIASLATSDAQAVQFAMLALLFTIFFSGLVVSLDRLSEGIRYLAFLVPATAGTSALQDVMFRGRPPATYLLAVLAAYAVATLLLGRWGLGRQEVA